MDADYTYPAKFIPNLIKELERSELVLGSRLRGEGKKNIPLLNRIGNVLLSLLISFFGCEEIKDGQTGFRAFRKDIFQDIHVDAKGLEYETKMTAKAALLGYRVKEVPIEYRERVGLSKLRPIRDGYRMLKALLSIFIVETPILVKVALLPSIFLLIFGITFGMISLYEKFMYAVLIHAYFPLISALLILLSVQLFSSGMILNYLVNKLRRMEEKLLE